MSGTAMRDAAMRDPAMDHAGTLDAPGHAMQRRDTYRVPGPGEPVLACRCNPRHDLNLVARLRVLDLSVGGASLALEDPALARAAGDMLGNCRIELPGVGMLACSMQIRHLHHFSGIDAGRAHARLGCVFIDLPGPSATLLQRYLNSLQRARRAAELMQARTRA
jgi:c-di-GMP-binding flagellar brake protein YcgR